VQQLMFSRDYPHPEGTWPNTYDWIRGAFKGVPEIEARAILADNAIEWFGFDRAKLEKIAARIGPQPAELLGAHEVPPHKLEYFQLTSNYFRPRIEVNPAQIEDEIVNRPAGEFIPAAGQGSALMLG
jgi:hypothetical protein